MSIKIFIIYNNSFTTIKQSNKLQRKFFSQKGKAQVTASSFIFGRLHANGIVTPRITILHHPMF